MGNRSKFVATTATVGAFGLTVWRSRHRRNRLAQPVTDEAHAPGHQHLPPLGDEPSQHGPTERPWTKHRHGLRHPGRG